MEDELDDKILYQTYVSHMKLLSRIAWGVPLNVAPLAAQLWRLAKLYMLKPEMVVFGAVLVLLLVYMQALDVWSRNLLGRLQHSLHRPRTKPERLGLLTGDPDRSWELQTGPYAAYAVQGRRPKMEDRFVVNGDVGKTGVAVFAVFDGHGGEFAADFAKERLVESVFARVAEVKAAAAGHPQPPPPPPPPPPQTPPSPVSLQQRRRSSFRKAASTTDECLQEAGGSSSAQITDSELLSKLDHLPRPITREVRPTRRSFRRSTPASAYLDRGGVVDYGKLLTDEVLAADELLLEAAKKSMDVAGTTALIAVLEGSRLVVANVGDSRGVMCDGRGNAIPLSFDHKPQQMRERKRIKEAGGFVTFNGVWRVAGILATSRAMGDYPLKDKRLVIADPDVLTFDLRDHRPMFVILASDGLWDTFSNEEAVAFIKERLHEPDFGARSLTLQSYYRGSLDNITVIVINFKDNAFGFHHTEEQQQAGV